jgi:WD40 repeat protein
MNADGTGGHALTRLRGFNSWPAWSPDGHRIAFESDAFAPGFSTCDPKGKCAFSVAVVDAAGRSKPSPVTSPQSRTSDLVPVWSTSRRLLFTGLARDGSGSGDIWEINADGSGLKKLSTNGGSLFPQVAR